MDKKGTHKSVSPQFYGILGSGPAHLKNWGLSGTQYWCQPKPLVDLHILTQGTLLNRPSSYILYHSYWLFGFQGGSVVKSPSANVGDVRDLGLIPGSGRSPGEGNSNPLQYSEVPRTEEPSGLQSLGSQRVGQDWACTGMRVHTHTHTDCSFTHSSNICLVCISHWAKSWQQRHDGHVSCLP